MLVSLHSPLVQSNAAWSQMQNSNVVGTALVPEYVRVICNPNEGQSCSLTGVGHHLSGRSSRS